MSCQFSSRQNVSHLHLDISSHPHHSCYELWLWKWSLVFIMFIDDDHHRRQIATILTINPKRYFNKLNVKCKRKMIFFLFLVIVSVGRQYIWRAHNAEQLFSHTYSFAMCSIRVRAGPSAWAPCHSTAINMACQQVFLKQCNRLSLPRK